MWRGKRGRKGKAVREVMNEGCELETEIEKEVGEEGRERLKKGDMKWTV